MASWLPWAVVLPPLVSFLLLTALGSKIRKAAGWIGSLATLISLIFAFRALTAVSGGATLVADPLLLLSYGDVEVAFGADVSPLSAIMLVVVAGVSFLVHVYSIGYMAKDPRIAVYFQYLSLFTLAMLGLVVSTNWVELYVFWELVGAASFLLIGFDYMRPAARAAAFKAFIVTRIGDIGLFAAMILAFAQTKSLAIADTFQAVQSGALAPNVVTGLALLIFLAAVGKSGQFPLHVWLPDAMEGPTPVSALIHAATMVAAGVYLVAFTYPIFAQSPSAQFVVATIGAFTAIFAATMALVQTDIKRVLAYSTVSQLGYMMLALGAGSVGAAIFHLTTHAFFKALLFLAAGAVIHAVGTNDITVMGGLAKKMPVTAAWFVIAAAALVGLPPLAGFFSKDAVLASTVPGYPAHFTAAVLTVLLTAAYMGRVLWLVFFGEARDAGRHAAAHEAPLVMRAPMHVLGVLVLVAGAFTAPWTGPIGRVFGALGEVAHAPLWMAGLTTALGLLGLGFSFLCVRGAIPCPLGDPTRAAYRLLEERYYIDWFYERAVGGAAALFGRFAEAVDRLVIDGLWRGIADALIVSGERADAAGGGQIQRYNAVALFALVVMLVVFALSMKGV
ncbi:MAG: NADH-quinone oxidoreductase subunit L [Hydrogenibacillus sp.]|nr:NADH-quinone oxidoreductase subunit L [Hydrogenibacillus sp.]